MGLVLLPFAIGVRCQDWSWVKGPVAADLLLLLVLIVILRFSELEGAEWTALGLVALFALSLPFLIAFTVAAGTGVWWGRRQAHQLTRCPESRR